MALELHDKLIQRLRGNFKEVVDCLDDVEATGRVTGVIISPVFVGLDHEDRQTRLWSVLESGLTPEELENVGPIAALTPSEANVRAV